MTTGAPSGRGDPIERIRAKVARAARHIDDFEAALRDFNSTRPFGVATREDREAGKRIYFVSRVDDVPLDAQAIAADALSNLRSALDHVAHQMETKRRGAPPKQKVYFPIGDSREGYLRVRSQYLRSIGLTELEVIDGLEPFRGGKGHGFWQLNALNRSDKHHLLVGVRGLSMGVDISPTITHHWNRTAPEWARGVNLPPLFLREVTHQPMKVGEELYIEPLDDEVDPNRQFLFDIAFDQPGVVDDEPALQVLRRLAALVADAVSELGRFI